MTAAWIIFGIMVLYAAYIVRLAAIWVRPTERDEEFCDALSILVVYRNEEKHLPELLRALNAQKIQIKDVEFIFIDDSSEDNSWKLVEAFKEGAKFDVIHEKLPMSYGTGKKSGVEYGVSLCRYEYVLMTDADCSMEASWIASMSRSAGADFVSGPVRYKGKPGIWSKLVQLDFISLIVLGACMIRIKRPNLANGANMRFKKSRFLEVNGYRDNKHVASGDDVFLLQHIATIPDGEIEFNREKEAIVTTEMAPDFRSFVHQRLRWAGKTRFNTGNGNHRSTIFLFVCYLVYASIPLALFLGTDSSTLLALGLAFASKFASDMWFFHRTTPFFDQQYLMRYVILAEVFHPIYIVSVAVMSLFGSYQWKGRKVKHG